MSKYTTVTEQAKKIRKTLKEELGLTSRKVSVKSGYCGYSSKIDVTVKDLLVDIKKVEKIANKFYSVDRCERSGEILQGGNTYVTVLYDWEMEREHEKTKSKVAELIYNLFEEERKAGSCGGWTIAKATKPNGVDVDLVYYPSDNGCWGMAEICNVPIDDKIRVVVHSAEGLKMALSKFDLYAQRNKFTNFRIKSIDSITSM